MQVRRFAQPDLDRRRRRRASPSGIPPRWSRTRSRCCWRCCRCSGAGASSAIGIQYASLGKGFFSIKLSRRPQKAGGGEARKRGSVRLPEEDAPHGSLRAIDGGARDALPVAARAPLLRDGARPAPGSRDRRSDRQLRGRADGRWCSVAIPQRLDFDFRAKECAVEVCVTRRLRSGRRRRPSRCAASPRACATRAPVARSSTSRRATTRSWSVATIACSSASWRSRASRRARSRWTLGDESAQLFTGCAAAVEPYLQGNLIGAADALERCGDDVAAARIRGEHFAAIGDTEQAAQAFQRAGRFEQAADAALGRRRRVERGSALREGRQSREGGRGVSRDRRLRARRASLRDRLPLRRRRRVLPRSGQSREGLRAAREARPLLRRRALRARQRRRRSRHPQSPDDRAARPRLRPSLSAARRDLHRARRAGPRGAEARRGGGGGRRRERAARSRRAARAQLSKQAGRRRQGDRGLGVDPRARLPLPGSRHQDRCAAPRGRGRDRRRAPRSRRAASRPPRRATRSSARSAAAAWAS